MSYLEHREKKNIERIKKEIFLKNSNNPYYVNQTVILFEMNTTNFLIHIGIKVLLNLKNQ